MNEASEWYNAIGNVGFPIVIAIYLLIRFEKKIDTLRQSIDQLGQAIREYTSGR
ncbi:YvrJ family protein [Tepidibacillus infernus]|uniref:YvrJ family protein n=1 Tax=Tepidibacillus TaxID=1494427 RepID=UPI0008559832|nr:MULTISPECIES: YvrJ family protein [Tepidibacillus]GBF11074.1 yvrJ protein family protein [Tepidibacillus sp. HK-1]